MRFIDPITEAASLQTANPMNTYLQTRNAILQNQQQAIQNQYLAPTLAQQLQGLTLNNVAQGIKNQYLPQMQQATVNQLQEEVPYMQAEAQEAQSRVPLNIAQSHLAQQQANYYPNMLAVQLAMARARGLSGYAQLSRTPAGQQLLSGSRGAMNQFVDMMTGGMVNDQTQQNLQQSNQNINQASQKTLSDVLSNPQQSIDTQNMSTIPWNSSQQTNQDAVVNNINQPVTSPDLISQMMTAEGNSLTKSTTPAPILNQLFYGNSVDKMLGQVAPMMPQISQFAGIAGHSRLKASEMGAQLGQNDPSYTAYNNFVKVWVPLIVNEARRNFGGQATDGERELLTDVGNPITWENNPQLALSQFNSLVSALRANNQSLITPPSQIGTTVQQNIANPPYTSTVPVTQSGIGQDSGLQKISMVDPQGRRFKVPSNLIDKMSGVGWKKA